MRLIDADKLIRHLSDWALHDNANEIRECMKAVEEQPTIDPVKRGRWIKLTDGKNASNWFGCHGCSVCGNYGQGIQYFRYCPSCGALMDVEDDHDDHL